jgi:Ca2+-binding EF-hand superfamily protein
VAKQCQEGVVSPRRKAYSKEKIEEWREAFKIFDQDGNGQISRSELGAVMEQLGASLGRIEKTVGDSSEKKKKKNGSY